MKIWYERMRKNIIMRYDQNINVSILKHRLIEMKVKTEQNGYPSRVRVGRGSDKEGHLGIWAGAVSSKCWKRMDR